MGENSKIEWCHHTFNPWVGCSKVSAGCANCYAESLMDRRLGKAQWGENGTRVRTSAAYWKQPLKWNERGMVCVDCATPVGSDGDCACGQVGATGKLRRARVFCASLADVFEDRPELAPWRADLFNLIEETPHLDWLILTKRPENILSTLEAIPWAEDDSGPKIKGARCLPWPNVWIGTSVENQEQADKRIPELLKVPAKVRFLSCEPLLGPIEFANVTRRSDCLQVLGTPMLQGIHWVICGGESGHNARPMHPDWARSLRDQCQEAGVPFFMKQMDKKTLIPPDLFIREFPEVQP